MEVKHGDKVLKFNTDEYARFKSFIYMLIKNRADNGESHSKIAKDFDCEDATIADVLKRIKTGHIGLEVEMPTNHQARKYAKIVDLFDGGMKPIEIATQLAICQASVYAALKDANRDGIASMQRQNRNKNIIDEYKSGKKKLFISIDHNLGISQIDKIIQQGENNVSY